MRKLRAPRRAPCGFRPSFDSGVGADADAVTGRVPVDRRRGAPPIPVAPSGGATGRAGTAMASRAAHHRGSAVVQWVLVAPLLLATVAAMLFAAYLWFAQSQSFAVAQEGARRLAAVDGEVPDTLAYCGRLLDETLGPQAGRFTITAEVRGEVAYVAVEGRFDLPLLGERVAVPVRSAASVPRERFRTTR